MAKHGSVVGPEELAKLGIDISLLQSMPRGGRGAQWAPAWRVACEVLFVNGFTPSQINHTLGDGPDARTLYLWAEQGDWLGKRDLYIKDLANKALAASKDSTSDVINRHLKAMRVAETAIIQSIVTRQVSAKTLEGAVTALVTAVRMERQILGINDTTNAPASSQVNVYMNQLNVQDPEQRDKVFEVMRQKLEIEDRLHALTTGDQSEGGGVHDPTVIENQDREGGVTPEGGE